MFVPIWLLISSAVVVLVLLARERRSRRMLQWALQDAQVRAEEAVRTAARRRNAGDPDGALAALGAFIADIHQPRVTPFAAHARAPRTDSVPPPTA